MKISVPARQRAVPGEQTGSGKTVDQEAVGLRPPHQHALHPQNQPAQALRPRRVRHPLQTRRPASQTPQQLVGGLPRLTAVIAPPADRIRYYVPKEIRNEAKELAQRLRDSSDSGIQK